MPSQPQYSTTSAVQIRSSGTQVPELEPSQLAPSQTALSHCDPSRQEPPTGRSSWPTMRGREPGFLTEEPAAFGETTAAWPGGTCIGRCAGQAPRSMTADEGKKKPKQRGAPSFTNMPAWILQNRSGQHQLQLGIPGRLGEWGIAWEDSSE